MKYVFIDLGAYNGDTIELFYNGMLCRLPVEPSEFEIYAFEPNPNFHQSMFDITRKYRNVIFSNKAAWIDDGFIQFNIDPSYDAPYGSSVMQTKEGWGKGQVIEAQCFDLSQWIKQFKNDYVIVKMDIEGAEFPILRKMVSENTVGIIKELYCEFHPNKVREFTTIDKNKLMSDLNKFTNLFEWH